MVARLARSCHLFIALLLSPQHCKRIGQNIAAWATMKVLSAPTEFDRLFSGGRLLGDRPGRPSIQALATACTSEVQ